MAVTAERWIDPLLEQDHSEAGTGLILCWLQSDPVPAIDAKNEGTTDCLVIYLFVSHLPICVIYLNTPHYGFEMLILVQYNFTIELRCRS